VTNVDSQASDANIVIQVIGEMSNKNELHRKFVQTFILAAQTNGYFVLNDIFRYINNEDEEAEAQEQASAASAGFQEPASTAAEPEVKKETVSQEDVSVVDKKLEEVAKEETAKEEAPATNGSPAGKEEEEEAEEVPAVPVSAPEEAKAEEPEEPAAEEALEPEKPKDPAPTPAPERKQTPKPAATPAAPAKPSAPKTWAQLASQNRATAAANAAASSAATSTAAPANSQPKAAAPATAAAPTPSTPTTKAPPAREPSPADSGKEGSTGGWQTAGADHSRKASRAQAQPAVGPEGRVRAYVKNVYQSVDADELKAHLAKYGELFYFDVSRAKVRATRPRSWSMFLSQPHRVITLQVLRVLASFNVEVARIPGLSKL
jgi:hypothetical protein